MCSGDASRVGVGDAGLGPIGHTRLNHGHAPAFEDVFAERRAAPDGLLDVDHAQPVARGAGEEMLGSLEYEIPSQMAEHEQRFASGRGIGHGSDGLQARGLQCRGAAVAGSRAGGRAGRSAGNNCALVRTFRVR